jgi:hypothetical protein
MTTAIFWQLSSLFTFILFISSLIIPVYNKTGLMMRLYCILMELTDVSSQILAMNSIRNYFVFHIMLWVEIPILILLFCSETPVLKKKEIPLITAMYVCMFLVFFFFESFNNIGTYSRFAESIFMIVFALIYYSNELKNPQSENILKNAGFWFVSAFLIYYGGTLLVSLFARYVFAQSKSISKIWAIHNSFDLIKDMIIFYGLICYRKVVKA